MLITTTLYCIFSRVIIELHKHERSIVQKLPMLLWWYFSYPTRPTDNYNSTFTISISFINIAKGYVIGLFLYFLVHYWRFTVWNVKVIERKRRNNIWIYDFSDSPEYVDHITAVTCGSVVLSAMLILSISILYYYISIRSALMDLTYILVAVIGRSATKRGQRRLPGNIILSKLNLRGFIFQSDGWYFAHFSLFLAILLFDEWTVNGDELPCEETIKQIKVLQYV